MKSQVFVLGPGYVGREIIDLLLSEGQYEITTLVRREAAVEEFEKDGVKAVLGDLNDAKVIQQLSAKSDVVFHTATADHLESAQAILAGIEERAGQGMYTTDRVLTWYATGRTNVDMVSCIGKKSIYLHQSGASVLSDTSPGNNVNDEIYSDKTPSQIDSLSDTAPHRKIDLAILKARQKLGNKARMFIWMPPIIYGSNSKHKRLSIQIPALTRFACKHGQAGYVGTGKKAWGVVHVRDLAKVVSPNGMILKSPRYLIEFSQAYVQVLHWIEGAADSDPELQNPYFFCESGEVTWGQVGAIIGKGLYKAGRITTPDTRSIPESEYVDLFGQFTPDVVGCSCRNRADRLRSMGWKPEQLGIGEAFEKEDLPALLAEKGEFKASEMALS
ncbi:NAD dependent epimerase/dehydratase family protein [Metarhizium robertsii ARSEF 23]|uniref:NAD dependent epimerase/dehydratase family protein n=1 Tax=Metarhizium robertsii (strain ARSEF 23 / ATCC MYA-3075) TaxID=655844 RepID=E9FAR6_METRA|nr:NAD dependent epimerase/dehydratase family protein [Metarhizium robertsii ARSEF 23]EFY95160.1 NAD dependent epimerase/dehydratase family protein [Metarhizium robertsii ARSEF 23]